MSKLFELMHRRLGQARCAYLPEHRRALADEAEALGECVRQAVRLCEDGKFAEAEKLVRAYEYVPGRVRVVAR